MCALLAALAYILTPSHYCTLSSHTFCRGINRSVTTAAVFLTSVKAVPSFTDGVELVRKVRPQAGPLPHYLRWGQLYCERGFKC